MGERVYNYKYKATALLGTDDEGLPSMTIVEEISTNHFRVYDKENMTVDIYSDVEIPGLELLEENVNVVQ